jgi:regulatory protein
MTRDRVFQKALKVLAARPRSEGQLRERLIAVPGVDPAMVDDCIVRLKEMGFLDDRRYAESYAAYRSSAKPMGRSRLARELSVKKVGASTIQEALDSVFQAGEEETLIDRAIEKRIRTRGRPMDQAASRRLFQHLARLGFNYELIIKKIRALRQSSDQ